MPWINKDNVENFKKEFDFEWDNDWVTNLDFSSLYPRIMEISPKTLDRDLVPIVSSSEINLNKDAPHKQE